MSKVYRVTPLESKSIEFFIDVYECLDDGSTRGFDAHFYYRTGVAYREENDAPWAFEVEQGVHCDPEDGFGAELDGLYDVKISFGENFTEEEMQEIRAYCSGEKADDDGLSFEAWIFDGNHNFEIEEEKIYIYKPVKIDLLDAESGEVLEENIDPVSR